MKSKEQIIEDVRSLAYWLDNSIRLPIIGYRIGIDPILGIIPGVGDTAGLAIGSYIIVQSARIGVPLPTLQMMVFNSVIEAIIGSIPVLGTFFDAAYKANTRNLYLLERHVDPATPLIPPSNRRLLILFGALGVLLLGGAVAFFLGIYWLMGLLF